MCFRGAVRGAETEASQFLLRSGRKRFERVCLKSGSKCFRLLGFPRSLPSPRSCCQPSVLLSLLLLLPCHTFLFTSRCQKTRSCDCRTVLRSCFSHFFFWITICSSMDPVASTSKILLKSGFYQYILFF